LESFFKFVELTFLFVKILDQTAATFLHLIKSPLESNPERRLVALTVFNLLSREWVLAMPYIVGDKLFNLNFPSLLQVRIIDVLNFPH